MTTTSRDETTISHQDGATGPASAPATGSERPGWPSAEAIRLHRVMFSYLSSKAIFSALELGVFDALEDCPCTPSELGAHLGLADRPVRVLLLALQGEGLVVRDGDRYSNADVATTHLVKGKPGYMGALAAHQNTHFSKFAKLTDSLRQNAPVRVGDNYDAHAFGGVPQYIEITRNSALMMAPSLAANLPLTGRHHLVDLGCAAGAFSMAIAKANPTLKITAVDNAPVCEITKQLVADAGLDDRITVRPSNIFEDTFSDCDAALISNLIDGYDQERAKGLIGHLYSWLPEGSDLWVHSHMWERAETTFPFNLGLILVVNNTQGGEPYGETIMRQWLEEAGFRTEPAVAVSPISAVIRAIK
jgi:hypothetical protein